MGLAGGRPASALVRNGSGQPVPGAWVLICAAGVNPCESWHSTTHAVQAEGDGRFQTTTKAGQYVARAFRPNQFDSHKEALRHVADVASGATAVDIPERGIERLTLVIK